MFYISYGVIKFFSRDLCSKSKENLWIQKDDFVRKIDSSTKFHDKRIESCSIFYTRWSEFAILWTC